MASLTCEEAISLVFHDSESEFDSEGEKSSDESLGNSGDESFDEIEQLTRNIAIDNLHVVESNTNDNDFTSFSWEFYSYLDPFESDWLPDYIERPGILVDTTRFEPVDYFYQYFPEEAFNLMAAETNRYADQFFDTPVDFSPSSRFHTWTDTSVDEIKAFVALQIAMGLCNKPAISDYWNTYWLTTTNFGDVMPRNRFELLQTFLHFNDVANQVSKGQDGYEPLFKIQPLLDICNPLYEKLYQPKKCLSIDESMIKFKGRIFFRQYLPNKPTKWGIKAFVLCESESGYCLKSKIYTGKDCFERDSNSLLSDHVVLSLLEGYENKGHFVFMDNFYSSPILYAKLESKKIGACGTVRGNRRGMPKELLQQNIKLKKGDDPVFMRSGNMVACAWHDTKRFTMLSTIDTNLTVDKEIRSKDHASGHRTVEKPVAVARYNHSMAGVDRFDQMLGTYQYPHKSVKWYHTLYHRARETALVNAYIVYRKADKQNILDPQRFRQHVINGLLEHWHSNRKRKGRPSITPLPLRMTGQHFPDKFENKKYKPDCEVCSDRKKGNRRQTSFCCKQCNVPLCISPCFERYHTLKQYKM